MLNDFLLYSALAKAQNGGGTGGGGSGIVNINFTVEGDMNNSTIVADKTPAEVLEMLNAGTIIQGLIEDTIMGFKQIIPFVGFNYIENLHFMLITPEMTLDNQISALSYQVVHPNENTDGWIMGTKFIRFSE